MLTLIWGPQYQISQSPILAITGKALRKHREVMPHETRHLYRAYFPISIKY
jgi:hypothetical protein